MPECGRPRAQQGPYVRNSTRNQRSCHLEACCGRGRPHFGEVAKAKEFHKKSCKSSFFRVKVLQVSGFPLADRKVAAQLKSRDPHPISCAKIVAKPLVLWFFPLQGPAIVVLMAKIMYLKNLTVLGFKSFADKTSLNFLPGVTAIVGPNGCGKSNVSDEIRWVLGEQSAKALRGGEMADVIFNGTDGRKPIGMAEVSITLGEVDEEHLRAAGVEVAYNEVTVTRRVFRDGGSEYFVNKTPCRLKDIQQLFMGTGVGRTSYSIMAQGNITQIVSSKPDDRRACWKGSA